MKMLPSTAALCIAVSCVASSQASTILMDATTNNGSFDVPVNVGNTTGASSFGTGLGGGTRAARTSDGTLEVPGWTFELTNGNGFGGINYNSSTPAFDGLQSLVINNSAVVRATSDPITVTINTGDILRWRGAFGLNSQDGSKDFAYNMGLYFDAGSEDRVVETVITSDLGYIQYGDDFLYTGPGASSVQVGFVINVDGSFGGQGMADTFYLELIPEPSSLVVILGGIGLLAFRLNRRGRLSGRA